MDPSGHFAFIPFLVAALIGAVVGATTSVAIGALTGQVHGWSDVGRLALSGAVSGAIMGGGGFALSAAAKAFELTRAAVTLGELALSVASGAVQGGLDSSLQGGSFAEGAGIGALGGVVGYGVGQALGAIGRRVIDAAGPAWSKISNQVALNSTFRSLGRAGFVGAENSFDDIMRQVDLADVATQPNRAVFWSGYAQGNQSAAMKWAGETGRQTIEMTPGGRWLTSLDLYGPTSPLSPAQADSAWRRLSLRFAQEAEGEVNAFLGGTRFNTRSTFYKTELPTLYSNPRVARIRLRNQK